MKWSSPKRWARNCCAAIRNCRRGSELRSAKDTARVNQYARSVDAGEAEAIELALELHADRLLIDERKGRRLAVQEGLEVIGLLGVILLARRRGIIPSARALLQRLDDEAGMYLSPEIRDAALKSVEE